MENIWKTDCKSGNLGIWQSHKKYLENKVWVYAAKNKNLNGVMWQKIVVLKIFRYIFAFFSKLPYDLYI